MFVRAKKSGRHECLQVVRNARVGPRIRREALRTLGCLGVLQRTGALDTLASSRPRFADQVAVLEAVRAGRLELAEALFAPRRDLFSTRHQRFLLRTAPPGDAGAALQAVGVALGPILLRLREGPRP